MQADNLHIDIPAWVGNFTDGYVQTIDINARMAFVIEASRHSVVEATGGPFAAAVFEQETGSLVSLGVNLVTSMNMSVLHAEVVALLLAQQHLHAWNLADPAMPRYELFASTEPCSMCLGAIPWTGLVRLVTAARDEDARRIGFDEGNKPIDWAKGLQERGIAVKIDVLRDEACEVLEFYRDSGGAIYNPQLDE